MKKSRVFLGVAMLAAGVTGCRLADKIAAKAEAITEKPALSGDYIMPFSVTIGGQKTIKKSSICSAIEKPVADNAEIVVGAKTNDTVILNIYPCDSDAKIARGAKCAIILIKKGQKSATLDQTASKKKLSSGTYLMNATANDKTARVMFKVK
ncbi:MAG: hypothetical protein GXP32_07475 [Kiritimatiellaeota bacterium]|nr:hypothetical protein [Kiritimatiellota bacterium]